jgi:hypothetical protein
LDYPRPFHRSNVQNTPLPPGRRGVVMKWIGGGCWACFTQTPVACDGRASQREIAAPHHPVPWLSAGHLKPDALLARVRHTTRCNFHVTCRFLGGNSRVRIPLGGRQTRPKSKYCGMAMPKKMVISNASLSRSAVAQSVKFAQQVRTQAFFAVLGVRHADERDPPLDAQSVLQAVHFQLLLEDFLGLVKIRGEMGVLCAIREVPGS